MDGKLDAGLPWHYVKRKKKNKRKKNQTENGQTEKHEQEKQLLKERDYHVDLYKRLVEAA